MHSGDGYDAGGGARTGSRFMKYMGGNNGSGASRGSSLNTPMSVNVAPFVPKFAQMNMRENGSQQHSPYGGGHQHHPQTQHHHLQHHQQQQQQHVVDDFLGENHGGTVYFYHQPTGGARGPPPMGGAGGPVVPGGPQPGVVHHGGGGGGMIAYDAALSPTDMAIAPETHTILNTGGCFAYQGPPPHIGKFRPKTANGSPHFAQFVSSDMKQELVNRQLCIKGRPDPAIYTDIPQVLEHMRDLVPLEPPTAKPSTGYQQTTYKAVSVRDGISYAIRRIHGFRPGNLKAMGQQVETWKKLSVVNVVQLREVFPTKAFGDNSLIFVYDYYPLAETMKSKHFARIGGGIVDQMSSTKISSPLTAPAAGSDRMGVNNAEVQLWQYVVQLTAALRSIHASGLAVRGLDAHKVLVHGKYKVMLSSCGIQEAINPDPQQIQHHQSEDLVALGRLIVCLATGNISGARRDLIANSLTYIGNTFSMDLKNLVTMLLNPTPRKTIGDVMPMIGARFYHHIEALQLRHDIVENELSREIENGRLFRLLCKLNTIVERPEFNMDPSWAETGDRFLVKLFRDYLFHQVTDNGKPWMDMAHIVQCMNKVDAGVSEKIELVSRDQDSVIIVSYADLKTCIENAFRELSSSTVIPAPRH